MSIRVSINIIEGPEKGQSFDFSEGQLSLGRNRGDIQLSDKKISGRHAEFSIEGNTLYLEDLGSTNGTFKGSEKVEGRIALSNMDQITVGLSRLSVSIVEDVQEFKKANELHAEETPVFGSEEVQVSLPDKDSEYRDTGVERINDLIDDELNSFSKWDHPSSDAGNGPASSIPKVKVILNARKAPEGVSQLICSDAKTSIGRKGVDIRINDLDLSRKHSEIEIVAGTQVFVRDLASTNGTYVNGNRITHQVLKNGDLIQIGQSVFEVLIQKKES